MRPSIPRSLRAIAIATGLTLVLTSVAVGWTQLRNNYPGSPVSCTDVNPWYCIEWPKTANNLSITVEVYFASSVDLITAVPLRTYLRNGMAEWNVMPARNPYLKEITSTATDDTLCGPRQQHLATAYMPGRRSQ